MSSATSSRLGGFAGLLFAVGVLLQNGVFLRGNPLPSAPLDTVASFYSEHGGSVAAGVGWVAFNIPLLLIFGAAVSRRMERSEDAALWARVGFGGVVLLAGAFTSTTWLQAVLAARAGALAEAGQLGVVWDLHSAAFSGSGTALAVAMGAFSAGAWHDGTVPRWTAALGLAGAASLVLSGLLAVGSIGGGPGIFFQLGGFLAWVVWLLTASVRLVRAGG
jgi:hypothetical protein